MTEERLDCIESEAEDYTEPIRGDLLALVRDVRKQQENANIRAALDALLAEKVMGWEKHEEDGVFLPCWYDGSKPCYRIGTDVEWQDRGVWQPSRDMNHALQCVEKLRARIPGMVFRLEILGTRWHAQIYPGESSRWVAGASRTYAPALAVAMACKACPSVRRGYRV